MSAHYNNGHIDMMSRKNYVKIAAVLTDVQSEIPAVTYQHLAGQLADFFKADNPNFNRVRFMNAAGLDS